VIGRTRLVDVVLFADHFDGAPGLDQLPPRIRAIQDAANENWIVEEGVSAHVIAIRNLRRTALSLAQARNDVFASAAIVHDYTNIIPVRPAPGFGNRIATAETHFVSTIQSLPATMRASIPIQGPVGTESIGMTLATSDFIARSDATRLLVDPILVGGQPTVAFAETSTDSVTYFFPFRFAVDGVRAARINEELSRRGVTYGGVWTNWTISSVAVSGISSSEVQGGGGAGGILKVKIKATDQPVLFANWSDPNAGMAVTFAGVSGGLPYQVGPLRLSLARWLRPSISVVGTQFTNTGPHAAAVEYVQTDRPIQFPAAVTVSSTGSVAIPSSVAGKPFTVPPDAVAIQPGSDGTFADLVHQFSSNEGVSTLKLESQVPLRDSNLNENLLRLEVKVDYVTPGGARNLTPTPAVLGAASTPLTAIDLPYFRILSAAESFQIRGTAFFDGGTIRSFCKSEPAAQRIVITSLMLYAPCAN
jgi:hypothetical protein